MTIADLLDKHWLDVYIGVLIGVVIVCVTIYQTFGKDKE